MRLLLPQDLQYIHDHTVACLYFLGATVSFGAAMVAAAIAWKLCGLILAMSDNPKDYTPPGGPK